MNKTSRRKGGKAWKKMPARVGRLIRYANELGKLVNVGKLDNASYLQIPPELFLKKDEESKRLEAESFQSQIQPFEDNLRKIPVDIAIDVLNYSPVFNQRPESELIELISNKKLKIFERETGDSTIACNECMRWFEEVKGSDNLLRGVISDWQLYSSAAIQFFADEKNQDAKFYLGGRLARWFDHLAYKIDSEFRIHFVTNEVTEMIALVEIDRIRICPGCEQIFWAGRRDLKACSLCSPKLRKRKWRESISQERKDQYNKARRKKRKNSKKQVLIETIENPNLQLEPENNAVSEEQEVTEIDTFPAVNVSDFQTTEPELPIENKSEKKSSFVKKIQKFKEFLGK